MAKQRINCRVFKKLRIANGFSITDMSKILGVSERTIENMEIGAYTLSNQEYKQELMKRVYSVLGCTEQQLCAKITMFQ